MHKFFRFVPATALLLGALIASPLAAATPQSILDTLVAKGNGVAQKTADGVVITVKDKKDVGTLETPKPYKTPLVITATVKTDSNNIRLYFGEKGMVIFNWEMNGNELRHHDPKTGQESGVANQGAVPKNTYVTVRWTIDEKNSVVEIDGKERASFKNDYAGLSGKIGIGTYEGATVSVKSFAVEQLDGSVAAGAKQGAGEAKGRVEVVSATWGANGIEVDVTDKVRSLVEKGSKVRVGPAALGDPLPGTTKTLTIVYKVDGKEMSKAVRGQTQVDFGTFLGGSAKGVVKAPEKAPEKAAQEAGPSEEMKALVAAGKKTVEAMGAQGASWTGHIDIRKGVLFHVEEVLQGGMERVQIRAEAGGQKQLMCRIVMRDGFWYVETDGKRTKYRANEAYLLDFAGYMLMGHAEPQVVTDPAALGEATRVGDKYVIRAPLVGGMKESMETILKQMEGIKAANPKGVTAESEKTIAQLKELQEKGTLLEIDAKTGIVLTNDNVSRRVEIGDFKILDKKSTAFDIDVTKYEDQTAPLTNKPENLVMMGYQASWKPGAKAGDMDEVLLDVTTGKWRRIALDAIIGSPGTLAADGKQAWVSAFGEDGAMSLREVDLVTGANRKIGGTLAQTGRNLFPKLSADGKLMAAMHLGGSANILEQQVLVIDMATQAERIVGKPADRGPLDWAGDKLVFELRESIDPAVPGNGAKVAAKHVAVMDLSGKTTELVSGGSPVVVGDGSRIMFKDGEMWKTCDLAGKDVKVVGDGLARNEFPAPARDGKRVLMMKYGGADGPVPVIVNMETGKSEAVKVEKGLWGMPQWR